jgi:hypothetical protein
MELMGSFCHSQNSSVPQSDSAMKIFLFVPEISNTADCNILNGRYIVPVLTRGTGINLIG